MANDEITQAPSPVSAVTEMRQTASPSRPVPSSPAPRAAPASVTPAAATTTASPSPPRSARTVQFNDTTQAIPPQQYPYVPYPYALQTDPRSGRVLPAVSKPWLIAKLVLTFLSMCWAIIILSIACVFLASSSNGNGGYSSLGISTAGFSIPITAVVLVWSTAELITYCARGRSRGAVVEQQQHQQQQQQQRRGIHPGAHVGVHLVIWLACIPAILASIALYIAADSDVEYCSQGGSGTPNPSSTSSYRTRYCASRAVLLLTSGSYLSCMRALVAFYGLAIVTHFALFVRACVETDRRNKLKQQQVVVMPPVYYVQQQQGQQGPQGQHQPAAGFYAPAVYPQGMPMQQVQQNAQPIGGFYAPMMTSPGGAPMQMMPMPPPPPPPPPAAAAAAMSGPSSEKSTYR